MIRGAARVHHELTVRSAEVWLQTTLRLPDAVIVEPSEPEAGETEAFVRAVAQGRRPIPVLAACSVRAEFRHAVLGLVHAGAHEIIFWEVDAGSAPLLTLLGEAEQQCAGEQLWKMIGPRVPSEVRGLIFHALMYPERAGNVGDVARSLGVNRRTLVKVCERCQLPPPSELLSWSRVLVACMLLLTTTYTVEQIAQRLEYSSPSAFRNLFRRRMGCRPMAFRQGGSIDTAVAAFQRAIPIGLHRVSSRSGSRTTTSASPLSHHYGSPLPD